VQSVGSTGPARATLSQGRPTPGRGPELQAKQRGQPSGGSGLVVWEREGDEQIVGFRVSCCYVL
jgi:hypothetical protein